MMLCVDTRWAQQWHAIPKAPAYSTDEMVLVWATKAVDGKPAVDMHCRVP